MKYPLCPLLETRLRYLTNDFILFISGTYHFFVIKSGVPTQVVSTSSWDITITLRYLEKYLTERWNIFKYIILSDELCALIGSFVHSICKTIAWSVEFPDFSKLEFIVHNYWKKKFSCERIKTNSYFYEFSIACLTGQIQMSSLMGRWRWTKIEWIAENLLHEQLPRVAIIWTK